MEYKQFKQIIDNARDILVGKVTDPKAQVDAISYALIYKFMSDNDDESAELGGKRTYFSGEYEKYGWHNLMSPSVTGNDRVTLYRSALENMSRNPNIPPLFREIFNNATLTFNDPNTLNLFLSEIDKIQHDSGDSIGDAYEYLLSVVGSQGKMGQFRTPRHIIDFMVEIIDPEKSDKILDPACGTAGFLISAYKHLMHKYNENNRLTSEEKERIHHNFYGFDIDPGMTRIARVNMFLHGFKSPNITEHDTLSSEDYWDDRYNVIIANPPFMTPKGGVNPHKKFSVQANRAEILFVDYIITHLKPSGRAAIIVPDGISSNRNSSALTELRRNLVNEGLYAILSLPKGVFLPYADVKTDILLIDKALVKEFDDILFINIENVGHALSATQSSIPGTQIPKVIEAIKTYRFNRTIDMDDEFAFSVPKRDILANKYCILTGKRYVSQQDQIHTDYPTVELGSLLMQEKERVKNAVIPVWSVSNKEGFVLPEKYFAYKVASDDISNYKIIKKNFFAYNPSRINVGSVALNRTPNVGCVSPMYIVFSCDERQVDPEYLFIILKTRAINKEINRLAGGGVRMQLKFDDLLLIKIPLPPLNVQRDIVDKINSCKKRVMEAEETIRRIENEKEEIIMHSLSPLSGKQ